MLNAEDIVTLEKRWLKYKIKQKAKILSIIFLLILSISFFYLYSFLQKPAQNTLVPVHVEERRKSIIEQNTSALVIDSLNEQPKEENMSNQTNNAQLVKIAETKQEIILKNIPKWYLKIEPSSKTNDYLTSSRELIYRHPIEDTPSQKEEAEETRKEEPKVVDVIEVKKEKKLNIGISTNEMDTIKYLENKFYASENIVFAIMLAEELYNKQNYHDSIKWALTANELDSKSDKSWYWFAKNKIKLGEKEDAIKALETFLQNNSSRRLDDFLKDIKNGEAK